MPRTSTLERTEAPPTAEAPPSSGATSAEAAPAHPRERLRIAIARRKRLWVLLCALLLGLVAVRATWSGASAGSLEEALAQVAARDGVRVDPSTVLWLSEDGGPWRMRGAVFLGSRAGELDDLYYADVRPGGEGTALDVAWLTNLTRTASAEEGQLLALGEHLAYTTRVGDRYDAVVVIDLSGEPDALSEGWPARARWQNRVTNLQETGRADGFGVRRYQLAERADALRLEARGGHVVAALGPPMEAPAQPSTEPSTEASTESGQGERVVVFDPHRPEPLRGAALVELQPQTKGMPGTVSWLVDTVRNVSWIGPGPIEWLENRVFAVRDRYQRTYHGVFGSPDTAEEVAEDLAMPGEVDEARIAMLTVTDPELGWPPAPLEPVIEDPAVEGEGRWIPVVDDPYVNSYPNAPPAFFQTFLRADPERTFTRVYVTIWDPRQVQMRIQAGVAEPESATGERGTGLIPRDEPTLRHLVGAFNGGFQAMHGEFGMMGDGRVYIPPKPWAATVAVFDDGRVGMGSWPAPNWRGRTLDEELANRQIPEDVVDLRQNLTSMVEDGEWNPWRRWYWGAAPRGAADQTYTTRSGLCLTEEGFMAYFWSRISGPEEMATAMIQTRCRRAMHLDMNHVHCGFEFMQPIAPGQDPEPLARRPREDAEFEGPLPRSDGWRVRTRRAVRSMSMPFPRFIDRDARDFFYLTLRPVLPGPHLEVEGGAEGEGVFSTDGLPHAGWPHAFARAHLGSEEQRTWLVRIDPRRAVPQPIRREDHRRALAHLTRALPRVGERPDHALYARRHAVGWSFAVGRPAEADQVVVAGPPLAGVSNAQAAIGVDRDGYLVYAEADGSSGGLADRLRLAGVEAAVALPVGSRLAFAVGDAHAAVDGYTTVPVDAGDALAFLAEEQPRTEVMFPDNEPQPYRVWGFLQDRRVRYFPDRSDSPRFTRPSTDEDDEDGQ